MKTERVAYTHAIHAGYDWCDECGRESKALFDIYLIHEWGVGSEPLRVWKCITDEEHEKEDGDE